MRYLPSIPLAGARKPLVSTRLLWQRHIARWRRGLLYALGRLSQDDAQELLLDCKNIAGWHPLTMLCVEDVLEEALERYEHHPELERLLNDACRRIAHKFEPCCDDQHIPRRWAIDLAEQFARDEGISLHPRAESHNPSSGDVGHEARTTHS